MVALASAALMTLVSQPRPLAEAAVDAQASARIHDLPLERYSTRTKAVLLRYQDEPALATAARHALERFPRRAPAIIKAHGGDPVFDQVLRRHGAPVIPAIHFYRTNHPIELRMTAVLTSLPLSDAKGPSFAKADARGRYAIRALAVQSHDLLGQFVVGPNGTVERVQTERAATGVKRFFTAGLTELERTLDRGKEPTATDYARAAVDVAMPVALVKLTRFARGTRATGGATKAVTVNGRSGARLGTTGLRLVRNGTQLGIVASAVYLASHPSVLNALGYTLAESLNWPVWTTQLAIWFLVTFPLLLLGWLGWATLGRPLARLLGLGLLRLAPSTESRQAKPISD